MPNIFEDYSVLKDSSPIYVFVSHLISMKLKPETYHTKTQLQEFTGFAIGKLNRLPEELGLKMCFFTLSDTLLKNGYLDPAKCGEAWYRAYEGIYSKMAQAKDKKEIVGRSYLCLFIAGYYYQYAPAFKAFKNLCEFEMGTKTRKKMDLLRRDIVDFINNQNTTLRPQKLAQIIQFEQACGITNISNFNLSVPTSPEIKTAPEIKTEPPREETVNEKKPREIPKVTPGERAALQLVAQLSQVTAELEKQKLETSKCPSPQLRKLTSEGKPPLPERGSPTNTSAKTLSAVGAFARPRSPSNTGVEKTSAPTTPSYAPRSPNYK